MSLVNCNLAHQQLQNTSINIVKICISVFKDNMLLIWLLFSSFIVLKRMIRNSCYALVWLKFQPVEDIRRLSNWAHMLLLLSLELYLSISTHKYTQFEECFQKVWMPGIPFVLASCQGCSWTWMCSGVQGDPADNMAGPFTAEEHIICLDHVLEPRHIVWYIGEHPQKRSHTQSKFVIFHNDCGYFCGYFWST